MTIDYVAERARKNSTVARHIGEWVEEHNASERNGDTIVVVPDLQWPHFDAEDWTYAIIVFESGIRLVRRFRLGGRFSVETEDL